MGWRPMDGNASGQGYEGRSAQSLKTREDEKLDLCRTSGLVSFAGREPNVSGYAGNFWRVPQNVSNPPHARTRQISPRRINLAGRRRRGTHLDSSAPDGVGEEGMDHPRFTL